MSALNCIPEDDYLDPDINWMEFFDFENPEYGGVDLETV